MSKDSVRDKLWHTPLTLHVTLMGSTFCIPLDKRFLTICKHQLEPGHSAELFRKDNIAVVYTKLSQAKQVSVAVQHHDIDIGLLMVDGRAYEETPSLNPNTQVHGLKSLAESIISRHAVVPNCQLIPAMTQSLPVYSDLQLCKRTLQAMQLKLKSPKSEFQQRVFKSLVREKLITPTDKTIPSQHRFAGLPGAHLMLKFNNNFISRMVSASAHSNLFQARAMCLNTAAVQTINIPGTNVLLGTTLESINIGPDVYQSLQQLKESQPVARVAYLNATGTKQKIAVYSLGDTAREMIQTRGLKTRKHSLSAYVAFTTSNTPILLGDFTIPVTKSSPKAIAQQLQQGGELFTRRWISAACNYHPELTSALSVLSRAVAPAEGSLYGYEPVPALDIWTHHQLVYDTQ